MIVKQNKKYTIVFDMDGVLIDASNSYSTALQMTFKYYSGLELDKNEIKKLKKQGGFNNDWDVTEYFLDKICHQKVDRLDLMTRFQNYYNEVYINEQPLVTRAFFDELSKEYNLAIFTGRVYEDAQNALNRYGFKTYFNPIITMKEVGLEHQKPDNLGLELIKKELNTTNIYYLGDTVDDIKAAVDSDVIGIGVLPPQDKSEELKSLLLKKGAKVVLDRVTELTEYLEKEKVR